MKSELTSPSKRPASSQMKLKHQLAAYISKNPIDRDSVATIGYSDRNKKNAKESITVLQQYSSLGRVNGQLFKSSHNEKAKSRNVYVNAQSNSLTVPQMARS